MPQVITATQIQEKNEWERILDQFPNANFLQSFDWGTFQESLGKKVIRVACFQETQCVGAAQIVIEKAKRGSYGAIAGGPFLQNWNNRSELSECMRMFTSILKQEGCRFIRFRPQEQWTQEKESALRALHIIQAPMHLTADLTLQLNLEKSEEELLAGMRKSTRYEVRRAQREGITVRQTQNLDEIDAFYQHQLSLAKKHGFVPFSLPFLKNQFRVFSENNEAALFHAEKDGVLLASAFVIFYRGEAVYHYGISTEQNAKMPGAYACQWEIIREAKRRGMKTYNFWGIAPPEKTHHRFASVSLFKRGFGGDEVMYIPAQDIALHPLYWITYTFETVRKIMRRL